MIETYSPLSSRVKTYQVVGDQTPEFAKAENPLLEEFLKQYYISQEHQGGSIDIAENLVEYKSLNFLNTENLVGFLPVILLAIPCSGDTLIHGKPIVILIASNL